jgi:hypothetical protein
MAKTDEIKFVDQHLEKVILGLCVLIMGYGVFQWVITAPQRSEVTQVNGLVVPTTEIDSELLVWAQDVKARKPKGPPIVKAYRYDLEIAKQRTPAPAALIGNWGAQRMVMIPGKRIKPPEGVKLATLEDVLLTFSPTLTEIKGLRELINEKGLVDKLVFRGNAEFPRGALMKAWNKEFRGSAMDAVMDTVVAVEIERRLVLGNGKFGPVTKVVRTLRTGEDGIIIPAPVALTKYTGKNADIVRKAIQTFSMGPQNETMRPMYWKVWDQATRTWTTPWIKAEIPDEKPAPGAKAPPAKAPPGQVNDGTAELWFHDTDVIVQQKYSYKMRLLFVNPLYTYDDVAFDKKDALVESIPSEWSQWTQSEEIHRTTQFFLTGAQKMGRTRQFYCTIFTRCLGQVVSEKTDVAVGRMIGGVLPKEIKNPTTDGYVSKVVNFSTNAIVVNIDFDKKIVNHMGRPGDTKELICLEDGKLVSRILVKHMPPDSPERAVYENLQAIVDGQTPAE